MPAGTYITLKCKVEQTVCGEKDKSKLSRAMSTPPRHSVWIPIVVRAPWKTIILPFDRNGNASIRQTNWITYVYRNERSNRAEILQRYLTWNPYSLLLQCPSLPWCWSHPSVLWKSCSNLNVKLRWLPPPTLHFISKTIQSQPLLRPLFKCGNCSI